MIQEAHRLNLRKNTIHLAVGLLDRYLASRGKNFNTEWIYLAAAAALMTAEKLQPFTPISMDFSKTFIGYQTTEEQIRQFESHFLLTLGCKVNVPYALMFLEKYLSLSQSSPRVISLCHYILELSLIDYKSLLYKPSLLAAGAYFFAYKYEDKRYRIPIEFRREIPYDYNTLMQVANYFLDLLYKTKNDRNDLYSYIVNVYRSPCYESVSNMF